MKEVNQWNENTPIPFVPVWNSYIIRLIREKKYSQRDTTGIPPCVTDAALNKHSWQANNNALDVI